MSLDPVSCLPAEISEMVLANLTWADLARGRAVCRGWKHKIDTSVVLRRIKAVALLKSQSFWAIDFPLPFFAKTFSSSHPGLREQSHALLDFPPRRGECHFELMEDELLRLGYKTRRLVRRTAAVHPVRLAFCLPDKAKIREHLRQASNAPDFETRLACVRGFLEIGEKDEARRWYNFFPVSGDLKVRVEQELRIAEVCLKAGWAELLTNRLTLAQQAAVLLPEGEKDAVIAEVEAQVARYRVANEAFKILGLADCIAGT